MRGRLAVLAVVAAGAAGAETVPEPGGYRMEEYRAPVPTTLSGAKVVDTAGAHALWQAGATAFLDVLPRPPKPANLPEGTIWHDYDRGQETYREDGEDWMTNVTVYLCASPSPCGPGASIATNVTTTNGYFRFTGNYTGTYTVSVATNRYRWMYASLPPLTRIWRSVSLMETSARICSTA